MERSPHETRNGWRVAASLATCLALSPFAMAQPPMDLASLDEGMHGEPAQVLVLGSTHLAELEDFDAALLDPLLDRLAGFAPEIITIEALSGEECDLYARHPQVYPGAVDWCPATDAARAATGLDVPAAIAAVQESLGNWPDNATPAQRRRLAALFLAAGDRASAYVQWLQLDAEEQHAGDGLDETLVAQLRKLGTVNSETYQIAAPLAARLGLPRLHAIDNHTGDHLKISDVDAFGQEISQAWSAGAPAYAQVLERQRTLARGEDMIGLYRYLNGPESLEAAAVGNIRGPMQAESQTGYPQAWVAGWEIRNLRMVANIRETFRERPGARVLSIVGVSHKPWFDAWLSQLQGVEMVNVADVLD